MPNILIAEKDFSEKAKKVLTKLGHVIDFQSSETFLRNLPKADVIVTALEVKLDKTILDLAKCLRLVGTRTTQLRYIDLEECRRRGIKVVNIKANSTTLQKTFSTAEETMALILSLLRRISWAFDSIKRGEWERKKYGGKELQGKTIGLIGFGRLGKMVAHYSFAFGMKVVAYDPFIGGTEMNYCGVKKETLENLLKKSDIVSLHAIYNDTTYKLLGDKHFRMMKSGSIFINTARGEITDENALLKALRNKWIAGAAVDTLSDESPDGGHLLKNPLVTHAKNYENLLIVPHLGGATQEATERTQIYIASLVAREIKNLFK